MHNSAPKNLNMFYNILSVTVHGTLTVVTLLKRLTKTVNQYIKGANFPLIPNKSPSISFKECNFQNSPILIHIKGNGQLIAHKN